MPNFVSFATSIAELAHGEKSCTQLLAHSPSLFDAPETEAVALRDKAVQLINYTKHGSITDQRLAFEHRRSTVEHNDRLHVVEQQFTYTTKQSDEVGIRQRVAMTITQTFV